jgi:hypothetical protein
VPSEEEDNDFCLGDVLRVLEIHPSLRPKPSVKPVYNSKNYTDNIHPFGFRPVRKFNRSNNKWQGTGLIGQNSSSGQIDLYLDSV